MTSACANRLQCCPPTCSAAATVVVSAAFARRNGLGKAVEVAGQALTTDTTTSFGERSVIHGVGFDMTRRAAAAAYEQAGAGPEDLDVLELHDSFTVNEVLSYEALGVAREGEAEKFIEDGASTYGVKVVVNPSGALLSQSARGEHGHPVGGAALPGAENRGAARS